MSWWDRATTEQRLAQIDGGIECDMTAAEIAVNLRMTDAGAARRVRQYANCHQRYFGHSYEKSVRKGQRGSEVSAVLRLRKASEFCGNDPASSRVAELFPREYDAPLFDPHPYEEA